jgi:hypothetical protein
MTVIKAAYTAEQIISGIPYVINSTAYTSQSHYFMDGDGIERDSQWVSVTNTGLTGTLGVSFTPTGFSTGQYFTLRGQETFHEPLLISKIYISGASGQPYNLTVGLTDIKDASQVIPGPDTIPNCYAWWKASSGTTLNSSNGVTQWVDSLNGHVLYSSAAGLQPTYLTASANFNNKPTLSFDGVNDQMLSDEAAANWAFLNGPSGSTMAIVCRTTASVLQQTPISTGYCDILTNGRALGINFPNTSSIQNRLSNSGSISYANTTTFSASLINRTIYAISSIQSGSAAARASTSPYATSAVSGTPMTNITPISTFKVSYPWWAYFGGEIAEIVIFSKTLNDEEMNRLKFYFNKTYGTPY